MPVYFFTVVVYESGRNFVKEVPGRWRAGT